MEESRWIKDAFAAGTYQHKYKDHLDNSIYLPLIEHVLQGNISPSARDLSGNCSPARSETPATGII
ncbi:MAG: hypothetical protein M3Q71_05985 [Chloroflexota bacterium]|nr:hypothetical protein [Chloroflexota bacterium]